MNFDDPVNHFTQNGLTLTAWNSFYKAVDTALNTDEIIAAEGMYLAVWKSRLVDVFFDRFINRTDIWYRQWCNSDRTGYRCMSPDGEYHAWEEGYQPVTRDLLVKHFNGDVTISTVAIDQSGKSRWCCWDSDNDDGRLFQIFTFLKELDFNPILEGRRDSRDGHLWLLFDQSINASDLLEFRDLVYRETGVAVQRVDSLEFFPKSVDKQSQVRLPLGINLKPEANKARGWFSEAPRSYDVSDVEDTLCSQLQWLSLQPLDTAIGVHRLVSHYRSSTSRPVTTYSRSKTFNYKREGSPVDIRPYIGSCKRIGGELVAACPLCRMEGRDRHGDNLRVSTDGLRMNCVFGGPNQIHKTSDLYQFFLDRGSYAC